MALKNPKITYDVVLPDGKRFARYGEVSGYVTDRAKLIGLLAHPWGEGAKVENLRQVDDQRKPLAEQPPELSAPVPAPKLAEDHTAEVAPAPSVVNGHE